MAPGNLDALTVIPHDEIPTLGFQYLKEQALLGDEDILKFDMFLDYFRSTWMTLFSPNDWNISAQINHHMLANRTNNALESYNRHLNNLFTHPHPNIVDFVERLRGDTEHFFENYQDCQRGLSLPSRHRSTFVPDSTVVPNDYREFRLRNVSIATPLCNSTGW